MKSTIQIKTTVKGLENAVLRVRNNETKLHLEEVLLKIQDNRREIINKLENLTIESNENLSNIIITGKKNAKLFGFIKIKHIYKYEILNNGIVIRQKLWYDKFFKDIGEVEKNV